MEDTGTQSRKRLAQASQFFISLINPVSPCPSPVGTGLLLYVKQRCNVIITSGCVCYKHQVVYATYSSVKHIYCESAKI